MNTVAIILVVIILLKMLPLAARYAKPKRGKQASKRTTTPKQRTFVYHVHYRPNTNMALQVLALAGENIYRKVRTIPDNMLPILEIQISENNSDTALVHFDNNPAIMEYHIIAIK